MKQLDRIVKNFQKEVKLEIKAITPEIAKEWLKTSIGNRNLKKDVLQGLLAEITEGKWEFNGETIVFDENNNLLDGHHRLTAVVKSDTPIISIVVYGIKRSTWSSMDSGTARSLGDVFKIEGVPNYSLVSTGVSGVLAKIKTSTTGINTLGTGNMLKRSGNSRKDALDFYYMHSEVFQTMAALARRVYHNLPCFRIKEVMVLSSYLVIVKKHTVNSVIEFWNLVINSGDMFASMRSTFMNDVQETRVKMSTDTRYSYIATIWNYYIQKKYVKKVRYTIGEHVDFL